MQTQEKDNWLEAMSAEMAAHQTNQTWIEVPRPTNKQILTCRWVFSKKPGNKFKARLVAHGHQQLKNQEFKETFSPVIRTESIKILLAVSALTNKIVHAMDVNNAFLNGILDSEVFMTQAPGFESENNTVYKLVKSIYGLREAPAVWNRVLSDVLVKDGFKRVESEISLYLKKGIMVGVYVDDILISAETEGEIDKVKLLLKSNFRMKDMKGITKFIGMNIKQSPLGIEISLSDYIEKMLEDFGMTECNTVRTPTMSGLDLETIDAEPKLCDATEYRSLVGKLIFSANVCRFDTAYITGVLARHFHAPEERHYKAAKHVLRYLKGTKDFALSYNNHEGIQVFCDADWASTSRDRKSLTGYLVKLGGSAISWSSKKQHSVSLSTTESEFYAMCSVAKEIVWILLVLDPMDLAIELPITVYSDNQSAISLASHPTLHARTKHISIRCHYIRDLIASGIIVFRHISTVEMQADLLTKGLEHVKFTRLLNKCGLKKSSLH